MNILRNIAALVAAVCLSCTLFAQTGEGASGGDFMNSNGKIYVVVAVIVIIVVALFAYLFYLDRKIGKMEKEQDQH